MGQTTALGIVLAIGAFLLGGALWYQLFGMDLSFLAGCAAAGFTFKYFYDKDMASLKKLLNPEDQNWPVSYPVAWGCITDVLKRSGVETGVTGRSVWNIVEQDDSRGTIEAKLVFNQFLGVGPTARSFPREIHLTVQLTALESSTQVHFEYQMLSPSGAGLVRQLIEKNQKDFRDYVEVNKIQ